MKAKKKFCKDCKYSAMRPTYYATLSPATYYCGHPEAVSLVDNSAQLALNVRYDKKKCGISGKWWEQKQ